MSAINTLQYLALGTLGYTGSLNDRLLKYYKANGATSNNIQDAEVQFLKAQASVTVKKQINDMWKQYLLALGYTGTLQDMLYAFWFALAGGGAGNALLDELGGILLDEAGNNLLEE